MHIRTERLELRPFLDSDRDAAAELLMDETVKQTYMLPDFASADEAAALFRRLQALSLSEEHFVAAISLDGTLIGFLNDVERSGDGIELGYVIHPRYQGRGYMTEALRSGVEALFAAGFREVIAGAFAENAASIRVMQKCGMKKLEKTDEIDYRGKRHRCVYYSIRRGK